MEGPIKGRKGRQGREGRKRGKEERKERKKRKERRERGKRGKRERGKRGKRIFVGISFDWNKTESVSLISSFKADNYLLQQLGGLTK